MLGQSIDERRLRVVRDGDPAVALARGHFEAVRDLRQRHAHSCAGRGVKTTVLRRDSDPDYRPITGRFDCADWDETPPIGPGLSKASGPSTMCDESGTLDPRPFAPHRDDR
ncbi:hypothetical protein JCM31271_18030 [Halorubrum trueperi]